MWPWRRASWSFTELLLCLLIFCASLRSSRQEETAQSWDSRLIPTNSVYEQHDKNASRSSNDGADASLLHSLDENNVMEVSKLDAEKNIHDRAEEQEEEAYDDEYEVEPAKNISENSSEIVDATARNESSADGSVQETEESSSKNRDYFSDPSTNQYDAYYYYEDYDNSRPRYDAVDAETEEESTEEEASTERNEGDPAKKKTSSESVLMDEEQVEESTSDVGSSMEGSDKKYVFVGPPPKLEDDEASLDSSILIGEAVVSVVTTKSVVNGTISIPTTVSPLTTEQMIAPPSSTVTTETPENTSRILASVQTVRSISGARFLPFPVIDRVEQIGADHKKTSQPPESTESINDKLDRVQSELSSGLLTGGFRSAGNTLQLDVDNDRANRKRTTQKTPVISKFVPRRYNDRRLDYISTTAKSKADTTVDSLEGLLPRDFVGRTSSESPKITGFRWPSGKTTTTSSEPPEVKNVSTSTVGPKKPKANIIVQDISGFLPPGYKLRKEDTATTERSVLSDILAKSKVDISSLLPPDYNKRKDEEETKTKSNTTVATSIKVSSEKPSSIQDLLSKSTFDISAFLPKDYEQKSKNRSTEVKSVDSQSVRSNDNEGTGSSTTAATAKKPGGLKIVFPSRPGGRKLVHKITTPPSSRGDAPIVVTPRIQKGWPTRATTEFTGWPSSSTTPISIEKLLEAARTATVSSVNASYIPTTSEIPTTSTTTTTTTTPRPTTPGTCEEECEVAGTIRIVGNATWVPELLDRNTHEWQDLANEIEREMNFVFSKSAVLNGWFKKIRIDSFSQGSILVDYFVELANLHQQVNTQELKVIFHDSLRTYNANRYNDTKTKGVMRLGSFVIDPKFTDFVVIPKVVTPQYVENDDRLMPQWAIAVIVIGVGGLLFIIVFGVSVLVNRQNVSKLKPTMSTIYEEEVAKNMINGSHAPTHRSSDYSKPVHTIWTDPDISWNDKSFESTSNKILVDKPFQDNKKYNLYDSWRSEWNGYYYNPSRSSSKYGGYDSTTNLSNRHHPDYDTNF